MKYPLKPQTKSDSYPPIIFLFGPTGVGKTALLTNLDPSRFAVVNADSIQVYRHLDIGSAKASPALQERFDHYLIDVCDPWEPFTVADFILAADKAVQQIRNDNKTPLFIGGTAFYYKHFLYGLSEAPPSDEKSRTRVQELLAERGATWAHEHLGAVDPVSADRIHVNDLYRISRALEVWYASGVPLSSFDLPSEPRFGMEPLIIGLTREKEELHQRIEARVAEMFASGLEDEIRRLLALGADRFWPAMVGIGYQEFFDAFVSGEYSRTMVAEAIVRNSRAYAKRQMTFFRSFANAQWFDADAPDAVLTQIEGYLQARL